MAIRIETLYYDLEMRTSRYKEGLKNAQSDAGKFTKFIKENPLAVTGALAGALALVGNEARKMAGNFEQGIREVSTLVDTTVIDIGKLGDGVLDLFGNLPVQNVNDLTRGLYQLISAGVPAERALSDLEVAAKASIAGVTGVETSVRGITIALNAFSEQGLTAAQIADQMFTAVRLGQTEFPEMSAGIGQTAGLAAQLNIRLDDLLANMVAITLGGLTTRQAFQSLRQALSNVLRPTSQLKEQFPQIASEFNRARLESDGLTKFLTDLATAAQGNTEVMVQMFGSVEALNAVLAITGDGGERVSRIMAEMRNSTGAADEAFNKMAESSLNLEQQFKNNVSKAMIEFGEIILPAVNAELKGMIGLFQLLNGTVQDIKMDSAITAVNTLSRNLHNLTGDELDEGLKRLREGIRNIAGRDFGLTGRDSDPLADLSRFTEDQLRALRAGIGTRLRLDDIAPGFREGVERLLVQLDLDLRRRAVARSGFARPGIRSTPGTGDGGDDDATPVIVDEEKLRELMQRAQDIVDQSTSTMVDDARRALERFRKEVEALGAAIPAPIARALELMEENIATLELAEAIEPQLREVDNLLAGLFSEGDLIETGARLQEIEQQLLRERETTEEGSTARRTINDLLEGTRRRQKRVADEFMAQHDEKMRSIDEAREAERKAAEERRREEEQRRRDQHDLISNIERATGSALRLAQAFGAVSDETAQVLRDVIDLGAGIAQIATGNVAAGAFQAAAGLTGLVTGLFAGDPEAKRIREENTQALRDLARDFREASQFLSQTTGSEIGRLEEMSSLILSFRDSVDGGLIDRMRDLARLMNELGEDGIRLVVEAAERLGIEFKDRTKPTMEELLAAAEALQQVQFDRFVESFGGSLDLLQRELELFDIEDPIEQVRRLLTLFLEFVDLPAALERQLRGLDLTTAAGRAQAEQIIQNLFEQIRAGTLPPSALGGLTIEEFLNQLTQFERLLDQAGQEAGTTTQFAVQRSITEITGSRIAALLTTSVHWEEMTAHHTGELVRLLQGQRFRPLLEAPFVPMGTAQGAATTINVGPITINGVGSTREAGEWVSSELVDEINRQLAKRLSSAKRALGGMHFQQ